MNNMVIKAWLERFKGAWAAKDMQTLRTLFDEDVEYWESPYQKLEGVDEVIGEWGSVRAQENITISTDIVMSTGDLSTVKWQLSYTIDDLKHNWAGLYIIKLDDNKRCPYFFQVGEAQA